MASSRVGTCWDDLRADYHFQALLRKGSFPKHALELKPAPTRG